MVANKNETEPSREPHRYPRQIVKVMNPGQIAHHVSEDIRDAPDVCHVAALHRSCQQRNSVLLNNGP